MPEYIGHHGFTLSYNAPVNELFSPVGILPLLTLDKIIPDNPNLVKALWDTGAQMSCIKPALFDRLKLCLFDQAGQTTIMGVGGSKPANSTLVHIFLTSKLVIEYSPLYVVDFPSHADILIGMDIIRLGDFAVCNADNKTSFSFAMPPFPERIDLAKRAETFNGHEPYSYTS